MIPQTFNDWTNCIVNDCKTNLTTDFAQLRLAVYQDREFIAIPEAKQGIQPGLSSLSNKIQMIKINNLQ